MPLGSMNKKIIEFLDKNRNLTLATCIDNKPYCANLFYAFETGKAWLIFKSDKKTIHIQQALLNQHVAGTISPDKLDIKKIQGVQFTGKMTVMTDSIKSAAEKSYYKKYPFALAFKGELWVIQIDSIKMTDNTLGFGSKLTWQRDS